MAIYIHFCLIYKIKILLKILLVKKLLFCLIVHNHDNRRDFLVSSKTEKADSTKDWKRPVHTNLKGVLIWFVSIFTWTLTLEIGILVGSESLKLIVYIIDIYIQFMTTLLYTKALSWILFLWRTCKLWLSTKTMTDQIRLHP